MTEIIRETTTTRETDSGRVGRDPMDFGVFRTMAYLVNFLFGVLEAFLLFRLVLKFVGANAGNAFVRFVYWVTAQFVAPFEGIFRSWINRGVETVSVLEPATIVAIFVYAFAAWAIVRLIRILAGGR